MSYQDWLAHHGIKGQKWGKMHGPPYPLTDNQRSFDENQQNTTSPSAMALMRKGVNSRFNKPGATSGGGGSTSNSSKSSSNSSTAKREEGKNYHDTLTTANRLEMLKKQNPDKYGEKEAAVAPAAEEKKTKSTKSSGKTDAEKAAEKAAKEKAAAEKAEKQAREQWYKDGKKAVDDVFNDEINVRSFKDLLDEFYNGAFSKNFKGEADAELEKKYDEEGNEIERTEGEEFYEKLLSRLDKNSKDYESFKEKYDEIMNDEELTSIGRLSKSISLLTDYADTLEKSDRSENNKIYTKILGYLDDKLKWYSEYRTSNRRGKVTMNGIYSYEDIEDYLKKHGF